MAEPSARMCVWCKEFCVVPKRGCVLCSRCKSDSDDGMIPDYIRKKLRATPARTRKTCQSDTYVAAHDAVRALCHYPDIVRRSLARMTFTPFALWTFLNDNNVWLEESDAHAIVMEYTHTKRLTYCVHFSMYEHAIACRIVDFWNIKDRPWRTGLCYYNPNCARAPRDGRDVARPSGEPFGGVHKLHGGAGDCSSCV